VALKACGGLANNKKELRMGNQFCEINDRYFLIVDALFPFGCRRTVSIRGVHFQRVSVFLWGE